MSGQKIGYIRVSSADQNTDRQLHDIKLDRVFTDKITGKTKDRPALQEMLKFIREGDHLFCHSMDRLARNLLDLRQTVKDLNDQGVKVTFVKENLTFTGTDEPMSILLLSMLGAVAEFERAIIRERQSEGIRLAKAKGVYQGRSAALTPEKIEEAKKLVANGIPKVKVARDLKICRETLYKYLRG